MTPPPLKSQPRKKQQTLKELQDLQRLTAAVVMRPLDRNMQSDPAWSDDRSTSAVAESFIKPNDRLSSFERIEIYNRQYWFRLIDCMYDDYPGLSSILGRRKFNKLIVAYLMKYPSRCYTLRNLGDRLEQFIVESPDLLAPRFELAREMAAFEWAQVVAFDGPEFKPLSLDDLLGQDPATLGLALQPYVTLLELHYPLDDYAMALKQQQTALRSEASNAVDAPADKTIPPRIKSPRRQHTFVAVHRHDCDLYFKRLAPTEYALLSKLRDGLALASACDAALTGADPTIDWPQQIQEWFKTWTELGWFCQPNQSDDRA